MLIDGQKVYAYEVLVFHHPRPVIAFDVRPIDEMQVLWLDTWRASARTSVELEKAQMKAQVLNQRTTKKVVEAEFDEESHRDIDIEVAPCDTPRSESIVRFTGIPTREGYGACVLLAEAIRGFSYAVDFKDVRPWVYSPFPAPVEVETRQCSEEKR